MEVASVDGFGDVLMMVTYPCEIAPEGGDEDKARAAVFPCLFGSSTAIINRLCVPPSRYASAVEAQCATLRFQMWYDDIDVDR